MIQASNGSREFVAGKGVENINTVTISSAAPATHVRAFAPFCGVSVALHFYHCAKNILPQFEAMLEADKYFSTMQKAIIFLTHA